MGGSFCYINNKCFNTPFKKAYKAMSRVLNAEVHLFMMSQCSCFIKLFLTVLTQTSSVNWHLMVSEFTWNIKTFVTLITIKINCENCDTRFNDSGKLRYHKVPLHGFSCNNCNKRFNEGLCSWRMVDKKEYQIIITLLFCTVKDRLCLQYLNLSTITFFHTILYRSGKW